MTNASRSACAGWGLLGPRTGLPEPSEGPNGRYRDCGVWVLATRSGWVRGILAEPAGGTLFHPGASRGDLGLWPLLQRGSQGCRQERLAVCRVRRRGGAGAGRASARPVAGAVQPTPDHDLGGCRGGPGAVSATAVGRRAQRALSRLYASRRGRLAPQIRRR